MLDFARRWWPLALITAAALWLRTQDLPVRPMHADEANQAVKLGELLEKGKYQFDPRDHHGPTLYYAALPIAWLRGERTLAALSETTVRLVPALFGTAAVVLLAFLAGPPAPTAGGPLRPDRPANAPTPATSPPSTKPWLGFAAAAFMAVSPPAVYYSRYFIQETLLLTFTLAAFVFARGWWRTGHSRWAVAAGICAGLMQATKATAPLFLISALIALAVARPTRPPALRVGAGGAAALLAALLSAALLYSSFGANPAGLRDAFGAYSSAATRFAAATGHEKPWWYYLRMWGWHREGGLLWQQVAFTGLAVAGFALACRGLLAGKSANQPLPGSRLMQLTAVYTLIVVGAFSFFPYKTPWQAVHFVPGLAVLAAAALAAAARLKTGKVFAVAALFLVACDLFRQTRLAVFRRPSDARNPYAYVHSSPDVLKIRALAEAAVRRSPDQPVRIISEEYWPLPWYLRGLRQVGYWSTPPAECDGSLIIVSADQAEAVKARLRGVYRQSFLGLRPGFVCIVYTPEP